MAYLSAEKADSDMSGIVLLGLTPGLLCELVLKDEFTFQIPALEIFPKTWGQSYIIKDMDVCQGFSNPYPLQT